MTKVSSIVFPYKNDIFKAKCTPKTASNSDGTLYGDSDLSAAITEDITSTGNDGFYFDAAACGTTNDLNTENDVLKNDGIVKFSAYLQSDFLTDTGSVLTNVS